MFSPTLDDLDQAREFLEFIASGGPEHAYISVVGIDKAGGGKDIEYHIVPTSTLANALDKCRDMHDRGLDVYAQLTLLRDIPPKTSRGKREYIAAGTLLWVDIDDKMISRAMALKLLEKYPVQPSYAVDSGHGLHLYWKLKDPLLDFREIECRNRAICQALGADTCWAANYILRVPGFLNRKIPSKPVRVKTIARSTNSHDYRNFPILAQSGEKVDDFDLIEEPFELELLNELPKHIYEKLRSGVPEGMRSENDWFVATTLLEMGWAPGQVLYLATHPDFEFCNKAAQSGIRYAHRTVTRAVSEVKRRSVTRPTALLQPIINRIITTGNSGDRLDLPIQSYPLICDAGNLLLQRGYKFVYDELAAVSYVISQDGEITTVASSSEDYDCWLNRITLFTKESKAFSMFKSGLMAFAKENGQRSSIYRWCHLDLDRNEFRFLADHEKSNSIALVQPSAERIITGTNGSDNIIMFATELTLGRSIPLVTEFADMNLHSTFKMMFDLTHDYFAVPREIKQFLTCYMFAAPLAAAYMKHGMLPLLHLTGRAGYGKTDVLKTIGAFIHGSTQPDSGTTVPGARLLAERDIWLPLDDYEDLAKTMKEFILTAATGSKRHKSSTDQQRTVTQMSHILIALTSVADLATDTLRRRAFRIEVSHEAFPTIPYNSLHKDRIIQHRGQFWSAYAKFLAQDILPNLSGEDFQKRSVEIQDLIGVAELKPQADFLALCLYIGSKLANYDERFAGFARPPVEAVQDWINYFELNNKDAVESYNELHGMLYNVFELYQKDLSMGTVQNQVTSTATPTKGSYIETPNWMRGIYVEQPENLPKNCGFDKKHTITITGKVQGWISTLMQMQYRDYFSAQANPAKQFTNTIRNLCGLLSEEIVLEVHNGRQYSKVYRMGQANLYAQFVYTDTSKSSLYFRIFVPTDTYLVPNARARVAQGATAGQRLVAIAKAKIASGDVSPEEALALIEVLKQLTDTTEEK